jgi:uroporphyrinogen-III synthase
MNVYACETVPNLARNSHLFATFIKKEGSKSEVHTISWYPADKRVRVIKSKGQKGINLTLEQTLERAKSYNAKVFKSDSYQIKQELYDKALKQIEKLENGTIKYQALSSGENVCNCIHVVANLAGPLDTGWNWGIPARDMIIKHFDKYIIK